MAITSSEGALAALKDVEDCCYRANEFVAKAAAATTDLPYGRGDLLRHTKAAGDALAALLRECETQKRLWEQVEY